MNKLFGVFSLVLIGCAAQTPAPAPVVVVPPPPERPTHVVTIDAPLPSLASDQVLVELRVIRSEAPSSGGALPSTLPSDGMMLTRLRTVATIGKPFACDASVQETSARLTGTITELDGRRYRASVQYVERFGLSIRQITSRIELPADEAQVLGSLMGPPGQDVLVVTLHRGQN